VAAQWLGALTGLTRCEHLFVAGLLHDIGKVFLLKVASGDFLQAIERATQEHCGLIEAERAIMGTDHAEAGGLLAQQWRLPAELVQAVSYHHKPLLAPDKSLVPVLVHVANTLAYQLAPESCLVAPPEIDDEVWGILGLSRHVVQEGAAKLKPTLDQAKEVFTPEKLAEVM